MLVVGWGLTLAVVAQWISDPVTGWFGASPGTFYQGSAARMVGRDGGWLVTWLVAVVLWVAGSLFLLRSGPPPDTD